MRLAVGLVFVGGVALFAGLWLAWPPLTGIVFGGFTVWVGLTLLEVDE